MLFDRCDNRKFSCGLTVAPVHCPGFDAHISTLNLRHVIANQVSLRAVPLTGPSLKLLRCSSLHAGNWKIASHHPMILLG